MPHFFIKLIPPRKSFHLDMSDDERSQMSQHIEYWTELQNRDLVPLYGPVIDVADGPYGMGVLLADSQDAAKEILDNDPSVLSGLNKYTVSSMKAVIKTNN